MATKETRSKPKDINFTDIVVDLTFHPGKDVVASGTIEGDVYLHSYSTQQENNELMKLSHHKKSCRVLRFSSDGEELHSASKDKSIKSVDLNTGTLKRQIRNAHESAIYSMLITGENFIVTGDDDGHLKMWDLRHKEAVMEVRENEEFISDLAVDKDKRTLLTTSGDGTLSAFNLRRKKLDIQSELFDSEFLSLAIMKVELAVYYMTHVAIKATFGTIERVKILISDPFNDADQDHYFLYAQRRGEKVVCGCGGGELNIFNWGEWGNISDRYPGHPMSVDCMVPLTQDIVCTGSCDGMIRAVSVQPNRFIGVVGEHPGDLPVENIALSRDGQFLASCSHDNKIKFWDMTKVKTDKVLKKGKADRSKKNKFLGSSDKGDFFADMDDSGAGTSKDDSDDDSDDDDDSDENDDDNNDDEEEEKSENTEKNS